jgi:hypothetical protein
MDPRPSVYVSEGQRKAVYQVSPSAALLAPFLEVPEGTSWKISNCQATGICNEFGGGWFPFALRDAAVNAVGIKSESQFQGYFKKLADEIQVACKKNILTCGPGGLAPGVTNLKYMPKKQIVDQAALILYSMLEPSKYVNSIPTTYESNSDLESQWNSVVSLPNSANKSAQGTWNSLGSVITLLSSIYTLLNYVFLISIILLIPRWKPLRTNPVLGFTFIQLLLSVIVFIGGISLLAISWGFQEGLGLYNLPGQSAFLMLGLTSILIHAGTISAKLTAGKLQLESKR